MGRNRHRLRGHGGDSCGGGAISCSKSKRKSNTVNGCMAAFYHLFDFKHFYFPSHHNIKIDSPSRSKVSSLKLIEESPPSTTYKDKQSLNIPVSMRVRTEAGTTSSRFRALVTDTYTSSSEICNSPGSKTPNLVARLMGLDLLPDKTDLSHSLSNLHTMTHPGSNRLTSHRLSKKGTRLGTRSLPASPRISSARKSDFDIHRLSLQLHKESEEFGSSRLNEMKQDQEENRSQRDYARQIVKQIKERVVTRRVVGMEDITNSVKTREAGASRNSNELRRDTTVSCSARTRFSDKENKPSIIHKTSSSSLRPEQITQKQKPKPTTVILVSVSKASGEKQNQKRLNQKTIRPINQCKKADSETRFSPRPDIRDNPPEAFSSESSEAKATLCSNPLHKKRSKKIPKLNDLVKFSVTEPPQKQINKTQGPKSTENTSIFSSLMHKIEENSPQVARNHNHKVDDADTVSASSSINLERIGIESEKDYIIRIMKIVGINTDSSVSSATLLDPSIFRELEHSGENQSGSLALRCNRRLLFDLLNEILTETVELHAKRRRNYNGSELIGELCSSVASYSRKRCSLPREIASVDVDHLLETKKLEEEGEEEIVAEIERDIMDALVRETASDLSLYSTNRNDVERKTESLGDLI